MLMDILRSNRPFSLVQTILVRCQLGLVATELSFVVDTGESCRVTCGNLRYSEPSIQFTLDKVRSTFITLVCVLLKNCAMMLLGVLATLDHQQNQAIELRVCVIRKIDVFGRL